MPREEILGLDGRITIRDDRTLATAMIERIEAIKAEAERRILAVAPLHKQLNAQARATELLLLRVDGAAWTTTEAAEAAALQAMRDAILAIRVASNDAEALVRAARANDGVDAVAPAWPEP